MIAEKIQSLAGLLIPYSHAAELRTGGFGIEQQAGVLTINSIMLNIISVGINTVAVVCSAVFIAGAFFLASSAGNDTRKSLGKDLMINAVIGIAIVAASKGILNLTYSFLYAQ
jgi:hypothetical protein